MSATDNGSPMPQEPVPEDAYAGLTDAIDNSLPGETKPMRWRLVSEWITLDVDMDALRALTEEMLAQPVRITTKQAARGEPCRKCGAMFEVNRQSKRCPHERLPL